MDRDVADELRTRYGLAAATLEPLPPLTHAFTHFTLTMHPQRVRVDSGPIGAEAPGRFWLTSEDAMTAALPAPIRRLLHHLPRISEERSPPTP
jgi:A/G-specific adenine glycosylase